MLINSRNILLFIQLSFAATMLPKVAEGQFPPAHREVEEVGIYGPESHAGAMAPTLRKWLLPQNLYYEYRWRSWDYSNFANVPYLNYVSSEINGARQYNPFGVYISRGWRIFDWTENNPLPAGSRIFKSTEYRSWFSNLVVSSAHKGQFHTSFTVSDGIRTTLTPLTFSKPVLNGMQWDFQTDKYGFTIISSRASAPADAVSRQNVLVRNSTRVLAGRGVAQVGDFASLGLTYVNAHNADNDVSLDDNSLKGVLTESQNTGNIETIVIRIVDDSPETPESGAVLFLERVLVDGAVQDIEPLVEGGIREDGVLKARGTDAVLLTYDIRNKFRATDETPSFRDAKKLEFELIMANDYRVEVSSNKQLDRLGENIFLQVFQARGNIVDGSNQRFLRFEYGLPTANEVMGMDFELTNVRGVDLRAEYALNRRFSRYPNQNFRKLDSIEEKGQAAYATASWAYSPWFAYGEVFSIDPDYNTSAFITNAEGGIDYSADTRHRFEFVDDNDDQDRFPDWTRAGQSGQTMFVGDIGAINGTDSEIFPGLDENNDFVSDFNQNRNLEPDYVEPFLRYGVDAPEFLFGVDMNNNTIVDRFEDDDLPDYPFERDRKGYNVYGGLALLKNLNATVGRLFQKQQTSGRRNRTLYGMLTGRWRYPGFQFSLFEYARSARDNIAEDRLRWTDPEGLSRFSDPLDAQDTFINSLYFDARYLGIPRTNLSTRLKWDFYRQRGEQADLKRNRSFFGWVHKADYEFNWGGSLTFYPKWKSTFRREVSSRAGLPLKRDIQETVFLITRYSILPETWLDFGLEFSLFENLEGVPEIPQSGVTDDFRSLVLACLFSNSSAYLGYKLTLNAGLQWERQSFKEETISESIALVRIYAATGEI